MFVAFFQMSPAVAAEVPEGAFALGDVAVLADTLSGAIAKFGSAPIQSSRVEGGPRFVCYVWGAESNRTYARFEAGPLGSYDRITRIVLSSRMKDFSCSAPKRALPVPRTHNGVRLGMSVTEFKRCFGVTFRRERSHMLYATEFERLATPAELAEIRRNWPNEVRTVFDVVVQVDARFSHGRLVEYSASRVESY